MTQQSPITATQDALAFHQLGEILEPSVDRPFDISNALYEALEPIRDVYRAHFDAIKAAAHDEGDPDEAAMADYLRDRQQDDEMMRRIGGVS